MKIALAVSNNVLPFFHGCLIIFCYLQENVKRFMVKSRDKSTGNIIAAIITAKNFIEKNHGCRKDDFIMADALKEKAV